MVVVEKSPSQFRALNLNITWLGHVTKKPTPPLNSSGVKCPIKRFKLISWDFLKTQNLETYFSAQILRDYRSLKCSYILMAAVGGCLIGRNRCVKMYSSILEGSRHPTSPNPSRNLAISDENMIFDKNLWFFEIFFGSKYLFGHFTYGRGINLKLKNTNFKIVFSTEFTLVIGNKSEGCSNVGKNMYKTVYQYAVMLVK